MHTIDGIDLAIIDASLRVALRDAIDQLSARGFYPGEVAERMPRAAEDVLNETIVW